MGRELLLCLEVGPVVYADGSDLPDAEHRHLLCGSLTAVAHFPD